MQESGNNVRTRIWDLPLRVFHWLLVILVSVSLYTGINGGFNEMDYHMLSGYCILGLVTFRVLWGFLGTEHARFASFVKPSQIVGYTRQLLTGQDTQSTGHNPLGALSVIAMLMVLGLQGTTGLFANDDIFLEGPLAHLVSDDTSDDLTTIHHWSAKLLYVLLGLHLAAIAFYEVFRKDRLILPMITGYKKGSSTDAGTEADEPRLFRELTLGAALFLASAGAVYSAVNYL